MAYWEYATNAAIEVKAKLSEKFNITNLGPPSQFLKIEIHRDRTGVSLGQKACIITILRRFGMEHTHHVSMRMDPKVNLDLAEDQGEKELEDIKDYEAVMGSLMNAALATRQRYLVCGCRSVSLQCAAIHQPYNRWKKSPSVTRSYSLLSNPLQWEWHWHWLWHCHRHRHRRWE